MVLQDSKALSTKAAAAESGRFGQIDVLRGLAAMIVVLSHYSTHCVKFFQAAPFGFDLDTIYGFYAVQLFFIISGFAIALTTEKSRSWRDFAFSRLTRLYPAYWVALSLMVVAHWLVFGQKLWISGYVTNLTMFQEFLGFPNLDNVYWALTVQLAFYGIVGAVFAAGLLQRIEVVGATWLAVACLWSLVDQHLGVALPPIVVRLFVLRHVPFFVAGIAFYRIAAGRLTSQRLALTLAALAAAGWIDGYPGTDAPTVEWGDVLHRLGIAATLFGIFGLAILGRLRFAMSPATLWLGGISYSLYLSHRNLGYSTMDHLHELGVPVWILFTVTLVGALVLAAALTYLVERPVLRALRRWHSTRVETATVAQRA